MSGARERALAQLDVSRETAQRLDAYVALLEQWNAKINLVARSTMADPWTRHVLDCGQLSALIGDRSAPIVDLGSGAGLPGLILAAMGHRPVHLLESDRRKTIFLREAARRLDLGVEICNQRIEEAEPVNASWATARACAPLERLSPWAARHLAPGGRCCFLKGRGVEAELRAAEADGIVWRKRPSLSAEDGVVLLSDAIDRHAGS